MVFMHLHLVHFFDKCRHTYTVPPMDPSSCQTFKAGPGEYEIASDLLGQPSLFEP